MTNYPPGQGLDKGICDASAKFTKLHAIRLRVRAPQLKSGQFYRLPARKRDRPSRNHLRIIHFCVWVCNCPRQVQSRAIIDCDRNDASARSQIWVRRQLGWPDSLAWPHLRAAMATAKKEARSISKRLCWQDKSCEKLPAIIIVYWCRNGAVVIELLNILLMRCHFDYYYWWERGEMLNAVFKIYLLHFGNSQKNDKLLLSFR